MTVREDGYAVIRPGDTGRTANRRGNARLRNGIAYAMLLYVIVAVAGDRLSNQKEWFPVFSWSLFSEVPEYGWATRLEIISIDGEALEQPMYYRDLGKIFSKADTATTTFNKLLNRIALDHYENAPNKGRLQSLNDTYLSEVETVEWRIVRLITDPIQHYKTRSAAKRYVWLEGRFPAELTE